MTPDEWAATNDGHTCETCDGEGGFHDCAEDVCMCRYHNGEAEDLDWFDCPDCRGRGYRCGGGLTE